MRRLLLPLLLVLAASAVRADQNPDRVPRDWRIKYERNPVATFVRIDAGNVVLRLADGALRDVPLWMLEGRELAYLQRQRCVFPGKLRTPAVPPGRNLLIDLSADRLPAGELRQWDNAGALGGAFRPLVTPPVVADVAGRKAVQFAYGPAIVAMDLNTLVADFRAPPQLGDAGAFSVAAWLYNPGVPQEVETFLAWHTLGGDDGTDVRYGKRGGQSFLKGAYCGPMGTAGFPGDDLGKANAWHHVAHVFTGGPEGQVRLYIDGRLVAATAFDRVVRMRPATGITATGATLNGEVLTHEEAEAPVRFFLGRRDGHYWARVYPEEPDRWNRLVEIARSGAGAVSTPVEGLLPDTEYVYRIQVYVDDDHVYWSDGPRRFRTGSAAGAPGKALDPDADRYVFLGSSWGSTWDWATSPRYFFTGAMASLKLYDYALTQEEVRDLCGPAAAAGPVAEAPPAPAGQAAEPVPADGAQGVNVHTTYFTWKPGPQAGEQVFYLDADRAAVEQGAARHTVRRGGKDRDVALPIENLAFGRTYYWRVETRGGDGRPVARGQVWSFATEDFVRPEDDGIVSEPFPKGVRQWGRITKSMECGGQPIIAAADTPDLAMQRARRTCLKVLEKRPDLAYRLAVSNTAGSLTNETELGWTELVCNTYGATRNMMLDPNFYGNQNMLMHEMGHQLHMNGMSQLALDFDHRLHETWLASMKTLKYLGHYGSNNMWEFIACAANRWINDGDERDEVYPRDRLRQDDPALYFLLNEYWSGDRRIELSAVEGVEADADGAVRAWRNLGGGEYWGRQGWSHYPGTVGSFKPVGKPVLATVGGVAAVQFSGRDAFVWDARVRPEMGGDHEWSVELWAFRSEPATADEVLLGWGDGTDRGVRLLWGKSDAAYDHGRAGRVAWHTKPPAGAWQHLVFVYEGGGLRGGPGLYRVYVNGSLDTEERLALDLEAGVPVVVGGAWNGGRVEAGFTGALAHVRVYDYDMHPLQVAAHYQEERPWYVREELAVAGRLLVDLDARRLQACPVYDHRPLYPESLSRPWVRSWANRGTMGGKVHNNVWRESGSTPLPRAVGGVRGIGFSGKDYMASSFSLGPIGTIEAWACRDASAEDGTLLELGDCRLRAGLLPKEGWHHLAAVRTDTGTVLYVDGQRAAAPGPASDAQRLHLGAHWDGWRWTDRFAGTIAQVRVHSGRLGPEEIDRNRRATDPARAPAPGPVVRGPAVLDLDAASLPEGKVERWTNRGAAGGEFVPGLVGLLPAPVVRVQGGRKGADFRGAKYLRADFPLPEGAAGDGDFTLSVRLYDPKTWQPDVGVLVSIGARPDRALEFGLDQDGRKGAFRCPGQAEVGFEAGDPSGLAWHEITWTYAKGGGSLRIYIDGRLTTTASLALRAPPDRRLALGCTFGPDGRADSFCGLISAVRLYDTALADQEVGALATGKGNLPDAGRLLVSLEEKDLAEGSLGRWPNRSRLGGAMVLEPEPDRRPVAGIVAGRAAVTFDGKATVLQSTMPTPAAVTGSGPLTVEAWVYSPSPRPVETVFSLAPEAAKKTFADWRGNGAVECNYGTAGRGAPSAFANGTDGFDTAWEGAPPAPDRWHHLAWVYSGGMFGTLTLYVDGEVRARREHLSLGTYAGFPMFLGAGWNTAKGPRNAFSGSVARLTVYDCARTADEVRRAASP